MRGHHDGLRGGGKVASELLLLLIGAKWKAQFKQAEIVAGMKLCHGQGQGSPILHPAKGHRPNPSWHSPQMVLKQDTHWIHVIVGDKGRLSKSGQLLL